MDPMTAAFLDEMEKISFSPGAKKFWKASRQKAWDAAAKRKGGLKGALASYAFTMGLAPTLGYLIGKAVAPRDQKKAHKEIRRPESLIGHSIMPGYSEYVYGRKSTAREILRKLEEIQGLLVDLTT